MGNPFVHVELNTRDPGRSKQFYGDLFGWRFEEMPLPDGTSYTMVRSGKAPMESGVEGGMWHQPPGEGPNPAWLPYVLADDIAALTAKARSLGATIIRDCVDVGPGCLTIFLDPDGAGLGLWQPKRAGG